MLHVISSYANAVEAEKNIGRQDYKDIKLVTVAGDTTFGSLVNDAVQEITDGYIIIYEPGAIWDKQRISRQLRSSPQAGALRRITREISRNEFSSQFSQVGEDNYLTCPRGLILETMVFAVRRNMYIPPLDCGFRLNILSQLDNITVIDEPNLYRKCVSQI